VSPSDPARILGFFTLVGLTIFDSELPPDLVRLLNIRNLSKGAPAVLLAQLGVDEAHMRGGLGTFLLQQALRQVLVGASAVGGVALIVDAVRESIARWYTQRVPDFRPLAPNGLRLILPMAKLAESIQP